MAVLSLEACMAAAAKKKQLSENDQRSREFKRSVTFWRRSR